MQYMHFASVQVEFPRQSESGEISRIAEEPNRLTWSWGKCN